LLADQVCDEITLTTPAVRARVLAMAQVVSRDLEERPAIVRSAEVAIIYNVAGDVARVHSQGGRIIPPSGHLAGTADLLEVRGEREGLVIRDYKTGRRQRETLDPETDPQLRAYALFAARAYGARSATIEIAHVDEERIWVVSARLDALELDMARDEIVSMLRGLAMVTGPTVGEHCRYCPILASCPTTLDTLSTIRSEGQAYPVVTQLAEIKGPEHLASLHRRLKMVENAVPKLRAILRESAMAIGPVEVEPGLWYGLVTEDGRERIDLAASGAADIVQKHLGDAKAWGDAVSLETSKAALERAARARAEELGHEGRGAVKQILGPLMADLRSVGAIQRGAPIKKVTEYSKKAEEET
jgi:hypothetical protein